MAFYMNVPYTEKDAVKALGAQWNPNLKKWYFTPSKKNYIKFSKWVFDGTSDVYIASQYIYLVEGIQNCWRCGFPTRIIGLGISEGYHIYAEGGDFNKPQIETMQDCWGLHLGDELHLAWVESEKDVPPKLLQYMTQKYSVKTGYSKTTGGPCFANFCDKCKALQGNWFIFNEDSSITIFTEGQSLIDRMDNVKIYRIPILDDLKLNFNISFCTNDYAYFQYGHLETLALSNGSDAISYKDLYYM